MARAVEIPPSRIMKNEVLFMGSFLKNKPTAKTMPPIKGNIMGK